MSILKKLLLYSSQFVSREGVQRLFVLNTGQEYSHLQKEMLEVPDTCRNPDITDFIFGVDDRAVTQRISQVKGLYLFVDYSAITSSISSIDVKTDSFHVAMTIARPSPENQDQAEELLWQDKALDAMTAIRKKMRDDFDEGNPVFWLRFPTTMQPFVAHALANSLGWTMEFDIQGIDMV